MGDILGFPHGANSNSYPCDVEPPCECADIKEKVADPVVRPPHYIQGNVEAIDIIEHIIAGYPTHLQYLIGSALKYLCRAPYKHPTVTEDLRKAQWYINRAVNKLG